MTPRDVIPREGTRARRGRSGTGHFAVTSDVLPWQGSVSPRDGESATPARDCEVRRYGILAVAGADGARFEQLRRRARPARARHVGTRRGRLLLVETVSEVVLRVTNTTIIPPPASHDYLARDLGALALVETRTRTTRPRAGAPPGAIRSAISLIQATPRRGFRPSSSSPPRACSAWTRPV